MSKVEELETLLEDADRRHEAMELIPSLTDKVVLTLREKGGLDALLHADLARVLALCAEQQKAPTAFAGGLIGGSKRNEALEEVPQGLRLSVVAGIGFEPMTFRL